MGIKVYIQVAVEGEDAVQKLIALGVPKEIIHVEDSEKDPLVDAIEKGAKVTFETVKSKDSRRNAVIARTIFIHYAKKNGLTSQSIENILGRDGSSIRWYLRHFEESMMGDMAFKAAEGRVVELLQNNPKWCPPKLPKPKVRKRRNRKKKY